MPNVPITPTYPLLDREFVYRPDLPAWKGNPDDDGTLVVAPGMRVIVRSAFTNWNAVPGLDMLYVYVPTTGKFTHVTPADIGFDGPLVRPTTRLLVEHTDRLDVGVLLLRLRGIVGVTGVSIDMRTLAEDVSGA